MLGFTPANRGGEEREGIISRGISPVPFGQSLLYFFFKKRVMIRLTIRYTVSGMRKYHFRKAATKAVVVVRKTT